MLLYAFVFLLVAIVPLSHSECCEEETRTKSLLDTASDLIAKARLSVPSCPRNEVRHKEFLDCADLYLSGYNKSGIYSITPVNRLLYNKNLEVYCDMETDGGGWTVIQRRGNFGRPDDFFYKDWKSYKKGFGSLEIDFWMGNDNIFALTNQKPYSIRFDLEQIKNKNRTFAEYDSFSIDSEYNNYTLHIAGYSGNAGECMMNHNKRPFSTKDKANAWHTENKHSCAVDYKGGWWYKSCYHVNINGLYNDDSLAGINWHCGTATRIMAWTEMKIRPANFWQKSATLNSNTDKRNSVSKSYVTNLLFSRK